MAMFKYFGRKNVTAVSDDAVAFYNRREWFAITISPNWGQRADLDDYARTWVHSVVHKLSSAEIADEEVEASKRVVGKKAYFHLWEMRRVV